MYYLTLIENIKKNKKTLSAIFIFYLIFYINYQNMPNQFYGGDSYQQKLSALKLLNTGEMGIKKNNPLVKFYETTTPYVQNKSNKLFYPSWSLYSNLYQAIPEIFTKIKTLNITKNVIYRHNIMNSVLSGFIAILLLLIAHTYIKNLFISFLYVLIICFSTFLWNYFRVQSYEIVQVFLFLSFYYFYQKNIKERVDKKSIKMSLNLILWNLFIAFLCLIKIVFIPLYFCAILYSTFIVSKFIFQYTHIQ